MKTILRLVTIALAFSGVSAKADDYVRGYLRSNGSYVQPHYRTSANNSRCDNYSSYGNINPYTGSVGYRREDSCQPFATSTYRSSPYSSDFSGIRTLPRTTSSFGSWASPSRSRSGW